MTREVPRPILRDLKTAFKEGVAPGLATVPAGLTYGILANQLGLTLGQATAFSAVTIAAAAQMAVLNLVSAGGGIFQVLLTTFLVNFRFSFLSAALSRYLRKTRKAWLPFLAFTVVTPTFGMVVAKGESGDKIETYMFVIQAEFALWWVASGVLGYLMPGILAPRLQDALGFAFPAILIGMVMTLIPRPVFKALTGYVVALTGGLLALAFYLVTPEWSVPLAAVVATTVGTLLLWKRR